MCNLNEKQPKVYLAGPDVFRPNASQILATHARACEACGLHALIPLDESLTAAESIFVGNVRLIDDADAVIADITPFRGPHCDVGTAWEIGYATAKGVPVFAYSQDPRPLIARIAGTDGRDGAGCLIEDFGLVENLMIANAPADLMVHSSFAAALDAAAALLRVAKAVRR
jgi:nucleoside 2-deoxyribosyltransferase